MIERKQEKEREREEGNVYLQHTAPPAPRGKIAEASEFLAQKDTD